MNELKDMLRYLRKRSGMTQLELATKAGVSASAISMYEVGNRMPDEETKEALADIFNVPIHVLCGYAIDDSEESAKLLQEFHDRPEMKGLFEKARELTPDQIRLVTSMIEGFANGSR